MGKNSQRNIRSGPRLPVVMIPGMMDSQMDRIWSLGNLAGLSGGDQTYINNVTNLNFPTHTFDISNPWVAVLGYQAQNGTQALIDFLYDQGYTLTCPWYNNSDGYYWSPKLEPPQGSVNAFVANYDWRNTCNNAARHLAAAIAEGGVFWNKLPEGSRSKPWVIIAHSMGGMVSRLAIEVHGARPKALITIGTPHHGSMKIVGGLLGAEMSGLNIPKFSRRVWRCVIASFPGAIELMPHFASKMLLDMHHQLPPQDVSQDGPEMEFAGFHGKLADQANRARTLEFEPPEGGHRSNPALQRTGIIYDPEWREWAHPLLNYVSSDASYLRVRGALDSGSAPAGVNYYFMGGTNKWTTYGFTMRRVHRTFEADRVVQEPQYGGMGEVYYIERTVHDPIIEHIQSQRSPSVPIMRTSVVLQGGSTVPEIYYNLAQERADATGMDPRSPSGGDDTVPARSAMGLPFTAHGVGVNGVANVRQRFLYNLPDGAAFGHASMIRNNACLRQLLIWLSSLASEHSCVVNDADKSNFNNMLSWHPPT